MKESINPLRSDISKFSRGTTASKERTIALWVFRVVLALGIQQKTIRRSNGISYCPSE
jgi:hypothetical protein